MHETQLGFAPSHRVFRTRQISQAIEARLRGKLWGSDMNLTGLWGRSGELRSRLSDWPSDGGGEYLGSGGKGSLLCITGD